MFANFLSFHKSSPLKNRSLPKTGIYVNLRPDRGGGVMQPPRFFADSEKKRRCYAPPGFGIPYGANLAQFLVKKLVRSSQVRSRSYDVMRGTTSGNFSNKSVFYLTLT